MLIKIHASGLCYTDVHQTNGELPGPFPRILGHEPVGRDRRCWARACTTRRVGDRVGVPWVQASCGRCEWCLRGRPMFCAEQIGTSRQMAGRPCRVHAGLRRRHDAAAGRTVLRASGADLLRRLHGLERSALGRSRSRTSASPSSASAGWDIWPFSTPRPPASRRSPSRTRRTRTGSSASSAPMRSSATARAWPRRAAPTSCSPPATPPTPWPTRSRACARTGGSS